MSELVGQSNLGKHGISTSTFYGQKKSTYSKLINARVQPFIAKGDSNWKVTKSSKAKNVKKKLPKYRRKRFPFAIKRGKQMKEKNPTVLSDVGELTRHTATDAVDLGVRKRPSFEVYCEDVEGAKTCKKIKLDLNRNVETEDEISTQSESQCEALSQNEISSNEKCEPKITTRTDGINESDSEDLTCASNSPPNISETDNLVTDNGEQFDTTKKYENDVIFGATSSPSSTENSLEITVDKKKSRTSHKKNGSLDAFFSTDNTRTTKTKLEESSSHESFRILGEPSSQESKNCCSADSSPLLFSQSSSSSQSTKSKSNSPESQSFITKYFMPLGKSTSITSSVASPSSDKRGKRIMKGRKVISPSESPVANKKEQTFLDLGQKNFGHIICPTCNMVYTSAQPEDEAYHVKFHHKVVSGLRFKGWKTEHVVEHFYDGRVIVVLPQDPPSHLKKVVSVRTIVDDELGFSSETSLRMQDSKTYLFIADKRVVGCVVAVLINEAFPLLTARTTNGDKSETSEQGALCCSSEPVRAQCGISRIWVLQQYRRKGIATRILDCVRNNFMFGGVVTKELLAFSDPTPLGKQLAESYCGTENFLVFR